MNKLLVSFLNKSFSKLAPNCSVTNSMVSHVIQTAAESQDFLENTAKKLGNKPNADIIFDRIRECDIKKLRLAFLFLLEFMILNVRQKSNFREWVLAIDTHYEPFYGEYKDLWVHGYMPEGAKGCKGSYCYITIAVVIGQEKFTLLALPVHLGQDKASLIRELILTARKHFRIRLVLLDRGFDSGATVRILGNLGVKYIIFARRNDKIKRFMEEVPAFKHKYFHDFIKWEENKSTQKQRTKYLIIKDYIDLKTFKIYDWAFLTNLTNTKAISHVHIYMIRWAIENTYKQFNQFRIKTISHNFVIRYFFFLFRVLLYNLWKFYNTITNTTTTFKEFAFKIFLAELNIDYVITCKKEIQTIMNTLPNIK